MFHYLKKNFNTLNNHYQQQINKSIGILIVIDSLISLIHGILELTSLKISNLGNFEFDLQFLCRESLAFILMFSGLLLFDGSKFSYRINLLLLIIFVIIGPWIQVYHLGYYLLFFNIAILLLFRNNFVNSLYLPYGIILIIGFIIIALFYGTIGSYILRHQFIGINSIHDAIYFTIVTYSTVGYGDITPTSVTAKYFVISMIIIGLIMFTSGITLVAYNVNNKLKTVLFNINKGKISMRNHIVIIGYGTLAHILIDQYRKDGKSFILIDTIRNLDAERKLLLDNRQLFISSHIGDRETLERARINEASLIIICYNTDEETIFSTMGVREYLDEKEVKVKLVTRVFYEDNIDKAKRAGADEVIAPHVLAAQAIFGLKTYS